MDTDWCLTCGRRTNGDSEAYCSKACMTLDRNAVVQSLPIHISSRRACFDIPVVSPPRHTSRTSPQTCRVDFRACASDGLSRNSYPNKARFRDDELQDPQLSFITTRWAGKDREGILVWAQAVFPGLDEASASPTIESSSMPDLDKLLTRSSPFPLTAQNLAPPCVTVAPRHVLLNHTSTHTHSHPEDRTTPSLSQDDTSLLTPATDSVITPSVPDVAPSKSRMGGLLNKVCAWIAIPARAPRATPEGNPTPPSDGDGLIVHSDETARCASIPHGDKPGAYMDSPKASILQSRACNPPHTSPLFTHDAA
ncbi:hypothetical protein K439DRAFT_129315 [Ramaria rubella]|nr:hypothetical protein K439DRAFT_129315 [Ramaria rubella]